MLENNEYEILKESLINSQRLFTKLASVSDSIANIDYDESGLYCEEEDMYKRHWIKLSSKVVDSLSQDLNEYDIELLENKNLELKELNLNLVKDGVRNKICVNYNDSDALNILQIS